VSYARDTDSIFVKFPGPAEDLHHHWKLGEAAAAAAGKLFKPPHGTLMILASCGWQG